VSWGPRCRGLDHANEGWKRKRAETEAPGCLRERSAPVQCQRSPAQRALSRSLRWTAGLGVESYCPLVVLMAVMNWPRMRRFSSPVKRCPDRAADTLAMSGPSYSGGIVC